MSKQAKLEKDFLQPDLKKVTQRDYVQKIREVVLMYRTSPIVLKMVENYRFRVGSFEDTSYKEEPDMLEEWEQFYLGESMKMEVIGVLEGFACNSLRAELVLMVCEDGKVFAYEDECMHLVAKSLKELFNCGLQFPGIKKFYRGQSFKDMTEADWDRVKKSTKNVAQTKEQQEMMECMEESYLSNLAFIQQRLQDEQPHRKSSNEEQCGGNRRGNMLKKSPRWSEHFTQDNIEKEDHSSFSHHVQPKKSMLKWLGVPVHVNTCKLK